ncbi:amino acid ABC transporter%2C periplasmic amino acid-binding protein [Vibrio cholerae]|nr:amino acid ABC transporter%2C periplasmic amino acid-binding protein [Vibrio cholerae]
MENAQQKGLSVDIVTAAFATQGSTRDMVYPRENCLSHLLR